MHNFIDHQRTLCLHYEALVKIGFMSTVGHPRKGERAPIARETFHTGISSLGKILHLNLATLCPGKQFS